MSHPNLLARGGSLEGIPGAAGSPCPSCSVRRTGAHSVFGFVRSPYAISCCEVVYRLSRGNAPPEGNRQPVLAELDWPLSARVRHRRSRVTSPSTSHAGRETTPRISRCRTVRTGRPRWLRQRRADRARPRSHTSADGSGDAAGEGPASVGCRPATPGPVPESSPAKKTASTGAGRT